MRRFCPLLLLMVATAACGPTLDVGSDVMWATDHESGELDDWYAEDGGGLLRDSANSTVVIADETAHSGRYSLELTNLAMSDSEGPAIYRELQAPPDAYYSAWYFLPRLYQTNSQWTIQKFRSRLDSDPEAISHGHDLNLRTLPGGQIVLYVFSHDPAYLQAPLADPPAFVPVETWFQIEVFYRPRTDESGRILIWLDDRLVYDLEDRRTTGSNDLLWTPCNIGLDIQPAPPVLYLDDASISLTRVTRNGKLFADR
ncbi:MAG TPA: hypothetical protein VJV79_18325 [Polyangiaceae bacterium]|nr:hypothetical protein [Polyangiaceae bacterium]